MHDVKELNKHGCSGAKIGTTQKGMARKTQAEILHAFTSITSHGLPTKLHVELFDVMHASHDCYDTARW